MDGGAHRQVPRTAGKATPRAAATRDVDVEFLNLSQTLAGYYLMGPGFERIAERFCRAAIAVKERWPLPPRSVRQLLRRRGDGWTDELAAAVRDIDVCVYEYLAAERQRDFAGAGLVKMLVDGSRAQGDEFDDRSLRDQIVDGVLRGSRNDGDFAIVGPLFARRSSRGAPQAARRSRARARRPHADERGLGPPGLYRAGRQRGATTLFADSLAIARRARPTTRSAATTSRPARRSTCRSTRRTGCPRCGRIRTASIRTASPSTGGAAAALRVHSVRRGPPQLRRREHGDRRAQDRRRDDRAAVRAHAGSGPARRRRRGHDDASALWHEHAHPGTLGP